MGIGNWYFVHGAFGGLCTRCLKLGTWMGIGTWYVVGIWYLDGYRYLVL